MDHKICLFINQHLVCLFRIYTSWKSKGIYNSKLIAFDKDYPPNIKYFNQKIVMQFDDGPLVVEQNNYSTKIVNVYIIYNVDGWPKSTFDNLSL